jgi:hypothetical protein
MPINATLENVKVPYLVIESLDWVSSSEFDQLSSNDIDLLQTVISDPNYSALKVSKAWNPFNYGIDSGHLALVNKIPWQPTPYPSSAGNYEYPNATL